MLICANESDLIKILEGETDTLTDKFNKWRERYENVYCPRCGCVANVEMDSQRMIQQGTVTARLLCRCTGCKCLFDPDLGIIVEMGNLGNLEPVIPIIQPKREI